MYSSLIAIHKPAMESLLLVPKSIGTDPLFDWTLFLMTKKEGVVHTSPCNPILFSPNKNLKSIKYFIRIIRWPKYFQYAYEVNIYILFSRHRDRSSYSTLNTSSFIMLIYSRMTPPTEHCLGKCKVIYNTTHAKPNPAYLTIAVCIWNEYIYIYIYQR